MVLSGGLVGLVLLWANGQDIGNVSRTFIKNKGYDNLVETGKNLLASYKGRIILPSDIAYVKNNQRVECNIHAVLSDEAKNSLIEDIGEETALMYQEIIRTAKTIFVNGPPGVYEKALTEKGTRMIWDSLGDTRGYTVIGGGDSITATKKYKKTEMINYICTGGGALIRFLSGEELPVVQALKHGSTIKR
jgi:phosphoglycerate kinase